MHNMHNTNNINNKWQNYYFVSQNTFNGRRRILATSIIRKYWRLYLLTKKEKARSQIIYDLVAHELRMRQRNEENGINISLRTTQIKLDII
jgi:hypothetical protein